jgi:hypothetical protein
MQWFLRVICVGYVAFLTLLLLSSDPSRLIGVHGDLPWLLRAMLPAAHLISFLVLATLALAPRWPVPRWVIVLILAIYGGMTEITQGFLPPRTPEWTDWIQDLGGIAVGTAFCWGLAVLAAAFSRPNSSDDLEALQTAVRSPTPGKNSWWA